MEYLFLLGISFLSATILPLASEFALIDALNRGMPPVSLVLVATVGNTAGAYMNFLLGRYLLKFKDKKWFYFSDKGIYAAQKRFNQYGIWSLLLAWAPIVGDPLTLIAGLMKVKPLPFILLVGIGKCARYCVAAYLFF